MFSSCFAKLQISNLVYGTSFLCQSYSRSQRTSQRAISPSCEPVVL